MSVKYNEENVAQLSTVHKLPCKIEYTGNARVSDLLAIAPDGSSSFRGRQLRQTISSIPQNYKGFVLSKSKTTTDTEEEEFTVTHSFKQITGWGWDGKPTKIDFDKLIAVQSALHEDLSSEK